MIAITKVWERFKAAGDAGRCAALLMRHVTPKLRRKSSPSFESGEARLLLLQHNFKPHAEQVSGSSVLTARELNDTSLNQSDVL